MSQATWFTIGFKLSKGLPLFLGNFRREASQPCRHFGVRRSRGGFYRDAGQEAMRWVGQLLHPLFHKRCKQRACDIRAAK